MTQAANIPAIEKATAKSWDEWVAYLDSIGAQELSHREIADKVYEQLKDSMENGGWWSQSVTVAYEQHIGRRQPGQRSDGTFEASATKTLPGSMDDALQAWLRTAEGRADFDGQAVTKPPTINQNDKHRRWACGLANGSRMSVDIYPRDNGKALLAITYNRLPDQAAVMHWRTYAKSLLDELEL